MFSFFSRPKLTIHSISIPTPDWTKTENNSSVIKWINPEEDTIISINFFKLPPDLPNIRDINKLRDFYRNSLLKVDGGIIEVEVSEHEKFSVVKTLFKLPNQPSGVIYLASLTIPFKNYSYVIKVQTFEGWITGLREAEISNRLLNDDTIIIDDNGLSGWRKDPYDPNFTKGFLMNLSENAKYDIEFPNHHLTKARKLITDIENNLKWEIDLDKIEKFV